MNIQHILATKGAHVTTIHPEQTIRESIGNIKPLFPWPPPAPSSTRLSPAPPDASLTPRRAAGRVPCQPPAGRRTADTPALPGAG